MEVFRGASLAVLLCMTAVSVEPCVASTSPPPSSPSPTDSPSPPPSPQTLQSTHSSSSSPPAHPPPLEKSSQDGKTTNAHAETHTLSVGIAKEGTEGGVGEACMDVSVESSGSETPCERLAATAPERQPKPRKTPGTTTEVKQQAEKSSTEEPGAETSSTHDGKFGGQVQNEKSSKQMTSTSHSVANSDTVKRDKNNNDPKAAGSKQSQEGKKNDIKQPEEKETQPKPTEVKHTMDQSQKQEKKEGNLLPQKQPGPSRNIPTKSESESSNLANNNAASSKTPDKKIEPSEDNQPIDSKPLTAKANGGQPLNSNKEKVKSPEGKPTSKTPEVKHIVTKNEQGKVTDVKLSDSKPQEPKLTISETEEANDAQIKSADIKLAAAKTSDQSSTNSEAIEIKNEEMKTPEVTQTDSKSIGRKQTEGNNVQVKRPDVKSEGLKSPKVTVGGDSTNIKEKPSHSKLAGAKPAEPRAATQQSVDLNSPPARSGDGTWPGRAERPARILAVMPYNARSHFEAFRPLLVALAQRGHRVDVVSHFPLQDAPPGYTDIAVNGSFPSFEDAVDLDLVADLNAFTDALQAWSETLDVCAHVLATPQLQRLLHSKEKYDLLLNEIFGAECLAGFAHKFNVPVVGLVSSVAPPGALDRVGNPEPPAYVSNYYLPFVPPLSFWQRAASALYGTALRRLKALLCDRACDALARRYFGADLPSSTELSERTAVILVNSHPAVNQPRPLVPAVVEVGGMHIGPPRPLPEDLERLVSSPKGAHGVVVVSLGTMVRLASFPAERLAALWAALGALPHLVLVKSKEELPTAPPPNVHLFPWLPQFDLLSHGRARLLLSHGGLLSVQEAAAAGVPVLGMPLFADQRLNVRTLQAKGAALLLEHSELTQDRLAHALHELLHNPSYRASAQALSAQFGDRPRPALQSAVWWVEYTLRHQGARHLRCAAADMPTHQLLLLDVGAALLLATATALGVLWVLLAAVYRAIRFGSVRPKTRLPSVNIDGRAKRYSKHKQQ